MRAVHVKPAQVLQAIGFAMFGAALFKALGPLVSPAGTQDLSQSAAYPGLCAEPDMPDIIRLRL